MNIAPKPKKSQLEFVSARVPADVLKLFVLKLNGKTTVSDAVRQLIEQAVKQD